MTAPALLSLGLLVGLVPSPQDGGASAALLVKARRIVVAPDTVLENDALLVRDGVVAFVGAEIPGDARRGAKVVEFDGTVVPGFVNPHTHLGIGGDLAERITALTPEVSAAEAFDPFDEALAANLRQGVTTLGLAPLSANTFAGLAAVVKAGDVGAVIDDRCYLKLALVDESLDQQRFPTSRMGATDLVRTSFAAARRSVTGDPKAAVLRDALAGSTRIAIHARSHGSIVSALDLCDELGSQPLLIGANEAEASLARLAALGGSVILEPLGFTDRREALELPAKLEAAGIPFSFMADRTPPERPSRRPDADELRGLPPGVAFGPPQAPQGRAEAPPTGHPESQRLSAALAVRYGTSRRAALAAVTRTPAVQCGVEGRVGSLRQGCDADFAVYSGDPLDLASRLLAVYVGGRPVENVTESTEQQENER